MMELPKVVNLIGTRRYPLSQPMKKRIFVPGDGAPIRDERLEALVRAVHKFKAFDPGACYTNTLSLMKNACQNGWYGKIESWAGWIVIAGDSKQPPIHHCWAVLNNIHLIDVSNLKASAAMNDAFEAEAVEIKKKYAGDEIGDAIAWRIAWNNRLRPLEQGDIIENRVWGQVPDGYIYVGCPTHPQTAQEIYGTWQAKYGPTDNMPEAGVATLSQEINRLIQEGLPEEEIQKRMRARMTED